MLATCVKSGAPQAVVSFLRPSKSFHNGHLLLGMGMGMGCIGMRMGIGMGMGMNEDPAPAAMCFSLLRTRIQAPPPL